MCCSSPLEINHRPLETDFPVWSRVVMGEDGKGHWGLRTSPSLPWSLQPEEVVVPDRPVLQGPSSPVPASLPCVPTSGPQRQPTSVLWSVGRWLPVQAALKTFLRLDGMPSLSPLLKPCPSLGLSEPLGPALFCFLLPHGAQQAPLILQPQQRFLFSKYSSQ